MVRVRKGGPHAEVSHSTRADERARGATLYVTLEPCAHSGRRRHARTRCSTRASLSRRGRSATRIRRPRWHREAPRGGRRDRVLGRLIGPVSPADRRVAHWESDGSAVRDVQGRDSLDGRVRVPGRRWVTGEGRGSCSRLRAAFTDAVAVGMGTVRADNPRLDARDVPQRGSPDGLRSVTATPGSSSLRPARRGARALAAEGVQSLLLEGGPTLATAFLSAQAWSTSSSSSSLPVIAG